MSVLDSSRPQHTSGQGCCQGSEASHDTAAQPAGGWCPRQQEGPAELTHAILHHHEAALVALKTLALKAAWRVDADATAAEVRRDPALVDVCSPCSRERKTQNEIRERWRHGAFHVRGCRSETWETRTERRKKGSEMIGWRGALSPS